MNVLAANMRERVRGQVALSKELRNLGAGVANPLAVAALEYYKLYGGW
jgi:hypothetical protein